MSDGGTSSSFRVSGGGSIAVDTGDMLRAASVLAAARQHLAGLAARVRAAEHDARPARRADVARAGDALLAAVRQCDEVSDGLRTAASRYGTVEQDVATLLRVSEAAQAAAEGTAVRLGGPAGAAGVLLVETGALAGLILVRLPAEFAELGGFEPWEDPVVLGDLALQLSSLDDLARSMLLLERPSDLLLDDPGSMLGTATIAGLVAAAGYHPAGGPLDVHPTTRTAVAQPADLDDLASRLPDGATPEGQVRIERYEGEGGTRWIVYVSGTVTFARDSGGEPFDMASNLLGVADRPADSQRVVLEAMRQAGVPRDEPVLLVGHSQGALNAVRVAEDGGYDVGGVVQFGGPTGQIALPDDVPVLSFEHDQDPVPVLGGIAAVGGAGARRVLVRRSLPRGGAAPGLDPAVPAHEMRNYRETVRMAEASGDPRVDAFRRDVGGFFAGERGQAVRYRGDRVGPGAVSGPPARIRTGDGG